MSYGDEFVLTLFTDDPVLAQWADRAGIDRIGPDLEIRGKNERQDVRRHRISGHHADTLSAIADTVSRACVYARVNPPHDGSGEELEHLLRDGVQMVMLPFFQHPDQVRRFVDLVAGRARIVLLIETPQAMARVRDIVTIDGVDEVHVGLNDLHLGLGLSSHFELLVSPVMDMLSDVINSAGLPFGFGGIGRMDDKCLPVGPDLVYPQYVRLRADRALVSRVFLRSDGSPEQLATDVSRARNYLDGLAEMSAIEQGQARLALKQRLASL